MLDIWCVEMLYDTYNPQMRPGLTSEYSNKPQNTFSTEFHGLATSIAKNAQTKCQGYVFFGNSDNSHYAAVNESKSRAQLICRKNLVAFGFMLPMHQQCDSTRTTRETHLSRVALKS